MAQTTDIEKLLATTTFLDPSLSSLPVITKLPVKKYLSHKRLLLNKLDGDGGDMTSTCTTLKNFRMKLFKL